MKFHGRRWRRIHQAASQHDVYPLCRRPTSDFFRRARPIHPDDWHHVFSCYDSRLRPPMRPRRSRSRKDRPVGTGCRCGPPSHRHVFERRSQAAGTFRRHFPVVAWALGVFSSCRRGLLRGAGLPWRAAVRGRYRPGAGLPVRVRGGRVPGRRQAQITVTGKGAPASAVSQPCSSLDRSARYWIVLCRTFMPLPWAKVAARASISGSPGLRGGVNVVAPRPAASTGADSAAAIWGPEPVASIRRCA